MKAQTLIRGATAVTVDRQGEVPQADSQRVAHQAARAVGVHEVARPHWLRRAGGGGLHHGRAGGSAPSSAPASRWPADRRGESWLAGGKLEG